MGFLLDIESKLDQLPENNKKFLKKIYFAFPFKKHIFLKLKKYFVLPEKIYRHLRFKEPFLVKLDSKHSFKCYNDTIVENETFWEGYGKCWEKTSLDLWSKLSPQSEIILDVGANMGFYSLVASAVNSKAKIFAFEPNPLFIPSLKKNISVNNFKESIFPMQLAVGEKTEVCEIDDYTEIGKTITCETVSVDDFVEKENLNKVDLIKIDVEYYEVYVIKGLLNTIEKYKPTMIIEILEENNASQINELLDKFNYLYFNLNEENFGIRKVEKLSKSDYHNFLVCTEEKAKFLNLI